MSSREYQTAPAPQANRPALTTTSSFFKSKAMKLWPSGPADQATPKADPKSGKLVQEVNPFDLVPTPDPHMLDAQPLSPGPRSPSTASYHHKLLNTHGSAVHLPNLKNLNLGLPGPRTPGPYSANSSAAVTPTGTPPTTSAFHAHAPPQTKLSLQSPDFKSTVTTTAEPQPPPMAPSATVTTTIQPPPSPAPAQAAATARPPPPPANAAATSRGQLHVKLLSARGLNVPSYRSRPYVVVQFEQSEFVSREPIASESEKEVKGKAGPLSRTNSSMALNREREAQTPTGGAPSAAYGLGGISKAFEAAARAKVSIVPSLGSLSTSSGSNGSAGSSNDSADGAKTPGLFSAMSPYNPVWKHEVSFDVTSDQSLITFTIYDRAAENEGFLGRVEVKPVLIHEHTVDQYWDLQPREHETVTGQIRLQITYEQIKNKRALQPRDFIFLKLIGRGTFGRVYQVRKRDTRRIYAMKVLSKKEIIAKKEVAHTIGERKILQRSLECAFLVGLKFSFQTDTELFLVTDFKSGGELFWHLQRETKFTEERARFYIAELVLALEHLHKYDIVYRDLKPENILLDATGHVALCDFGLSKPDLPADQLTNTFCGTTEYLAPEVLLDDHGYSKLVDFWSLGVLLFEMCCGWSPFYAEDTQQMYKNICFGRIKFPRGVIGEDGKQFVKGLLNRNPKHRLGAQRDTAELKEHPFFKSIDWKALALKQVTPPFKPVVESDESTNNFDPEFTNADLRETGIDIYEDDEDGWAASADYGGAFGDGRHQFNGPPSAAKQQQSLQSPPLALHVNGSGKVVNGSSTNGSSASGDSNGTNRPTLGMLKFGKGVAETPLSSSIQEHFRGFTYQGESAMDEAGELHGGGQGEDMDEDDDDVDGNVDPDDEWEDEEPGGRYAKKNKGLME